MLVEIQTDFPDTEIYFVTGSDKLYVLPLWHRIDELLATGDKILVEGNH